MVAFDWTEKEELQNLEFLVILMLEVCKITDLSTAAATDCCMADGIPEGLGSEDCSWALSRSILLHLEKTAWVQIPALPLPHCVTLTSYIISLCLFSYL